ncbi:hypothetical protein M758_3G033000 [Ceratodon purpureus]|nr:hypothetical protein M758_3G033000 [Ceratodon purpureus]
MQGHLESSSWTFEVRQDKSYWFKINNNLFDCCHLDFGACLAWIHQHHAWPTRDTQTQLSIGIIIVSKANIKLYIY